MKKKYEVELAATAEINHTIWVEADNLENAQAAAVESLKTWRKDPTAYRGEDWDIDYIKRGDDHTRGIRIVGIESDCGEEKKLDPNGLAIVDIDPLNDEKTHN